MQTLWQLSTNKKKWELEKSIRMMNSQKGYAEKINPIEEGKK